MKQKVSPSVFFSIIAILIVLAAGALVWQFRAPSAAVAPAAQEGGRQKPPDLRTQQHGPDADELQKIQEWKKSHPGAYTKY